METVSVGRSIQKSVTLRLGINQGDVYRLPELSKLRVEQGTIWLTQAGQDIVLYAGDMLTDQHLAEGALMSVVGSTSAVIELIVPKDSASSLPLRALAGLKQRAA
jgi:hypothetical protein